MCGIVGLWNLKGKPADLRTFRRATSLVRHRGPDDEGYLLVHSSKGQAIPAGGRDSDPALHLPPLEDLRPQGFDLVLGFRRLAILDLTPSGHQPMANEDGRLWVVLNGEIYNYLELRELLASKGHTFRSQSDTEVLLHGYEEYGEGILELLNGMFAFALWDGNSRTLFCARDRLGIKPLYCFRDSETFILASEIKAILFLRPDLRSPHYAYMRDFLQSGLLDHDQLTLFERIHQIRPAHYLKISPRTCHLQRYWDFDQERAHSRYDYSHPEETLRFLLRDAVRLQLRSDVPVGTCLSGGLDSTSVVALATSMSSARLKTFSSVYAEEGYDEGHFIRIAASAYNTESHIVQPSPQDFLATLARITWHMDEPTAGPGVYSQWFVMKEASGQVKVLLDGQGGDELLGGYHSYFLPYFISQWRLFLTRKDPLHLARLAAEAFQVWRLTRENFFYLGFRIFLRKALSKISPKVRAGLGPSVLHPDFAAGPSSCDTSPRVVRLTDPLNDKLYWDTVRNSIPALLHYEDRNSMAFSVEARVPLLDHRLVEFCLGLPPELKIKGPLTKVLLRRVMADLLPPEIVNRRDKKGYPTPLALWLRNGLYEEVRDFLLSSPGRDLQIFDRDAMAHLLREHHSGHRDLSWEIFRWISCELWFQTFIDRSPHHEPPSA